MKDYTKRNARYRGIPCWYNPFNNELVGKTWLYDKLLQLAVWFDVYVTEVEEFKVWVEVDSDFEKNK